VRVKSRTILDTPLLKRADSLKCIRGLNVINEVDSLWFKYCLSRIHHLGIELDRQNIKLLFCCLTPVVWHTLLKRRCALTVGVPVTRNPPCSPGRAVFPHPVPRSYSLSRRLKTLCIHPVLSLLLRDHGCHYPYSFKCSVKSVPGKTLFLSTSAI